MVGFLGLHSQVSQSCVINLCLLLSLSPHLCIQHIKQSIIYQLSTHLYLSSTYVSFIYVCMYIHIYESVIYVSIIYKLSINVYHLSIDHLYICTCLYIYTIIYKLLSICVYACVYVCMCPSLCLSIYLLCSVFSFLENLANIEGKASVFY